MTKLNAGAKARLGAYLYACLAGDSEYVTSKEIGELVAIEPSFVRRDLSMLVNSAGKRGCGYDRARLAVTLRARMKITDRASAGALLIAAGRTRTNVSLDQLILPPEFVPVSAQLHDLIAQGARLAAEIDTLLGVA